MKNVIKLFCNSDCCHPLKLFLGRIIDMGKFNNGSIRIDLTNTDINSIEEFVNDNADITTLDKVLNSVSIIDKGTDQNNINMAQAIICSVIFIVCLSILIKGRIPLFKLFSNITIICFLISLPWTWYSLYCKALAKQHMSLLGNIPKSCNKQYGLKDFLSSLFVINYGNDCLQYYESLYVNAILEVPPTKVFAVTLTTFVLEPIGYIGLCFNQTITNIFSGLPVHLWPVMLAYLFIFTMLCFCTYTVSRCKMNLFHCIKFEPISNGECTPALK